VKPAAYSITALRVITTLSIAGLVAAPFVSTAPGWWAASLFVYFLYACVGIIVGFHRGFSHSSFPMTKGVQRTLLVLGTMAGIGSSIAWVSMHHDHHRHVDTPLDPHTPQNGLVRMLKLDYGNIRIRSPRVVAMARDSWHRGLHDWYSLLHLVYAGALFAVGGWQALLFLHAVPIAVTAIMSHAINWFCHGHGYRRYDTPDRSTNNPVIALLTWGDGWHNNHHRYPARPNFGERWYELDISYLMIKLLRHRV
jgi:fatty-acid desaturase